jgi:hypothetical protein
VLSGGPPRLSTDFKAERELSNRNATVVTQGHLDAEVGAPPLDAPRQLTTYSFASRDELRTAVGAWCANSASATATYGNLETWGTGSISDMSYLFDGMHVPECANKNPPVQDWDTSSVVRRFGTLLRLHAAIPLSRPRSTPAHPHPHSLRF